MFEPEPCDQLCPLVFPGPGLPCPHGFCCWSMPTGIQSDPEKTQPGACFIKGKWCGSELCTLLWTVG